MSMNLESLFGKLKSAQIALLKGTDQKLTKFHLKWRSCLPNL